MNSVLIKLYSRLISEKNEHIEDVNLDTLVSEEDFSNLIKKINIASATIYRDDITNYNNGVVYIYETFDTEDQINKCKQTVNLSFNKKLSNFILSGNNQSLGVSKCIDNVNDVTTKMTLYQICDSGVYRFEIINDSYYLFFYPNYIFSVSGDEYGEEKERFIYNPATSSYKVNIFIQQYKSYFFLKSGIINEDFGMNNPYILINDLYRNGIDNNLKFKKILKK